VRYGQSVPKKYTTIDGVATLVHYRGQTTLPELPPDVSRGTCVICLHDAGTSGGRYDALLDALAANNSPMAYDQPGHGRSGGLDSLGSVAAMVAHLHTLVSQWGLPSSVLLGEGLGAAVAVAYAQVHPGNVSALVLAGSVPAPADLETQIEQLTRIAGGKARREFDRSGYAPDTPRSVYQQAFGDWVKTDPRTTLGDRKAQAEWLASQPLENTNLNTSIEVRVLVGEHDSDEATNAAQSVAEQLGGSTVSVAGAGRHTMIEAPEAVAAVIDQIGKA